VRSAAEPKISRETQTSCFIEPVRDIDDEEFLIGSLSGVKIQILTAKTDRSLISANCFFIALTGPVL